jgi:hypothetical protein
MPGGRNGCGTSPQRQPKMVQCETHCTLHLLAGAGAIGGFGEGEAVGIVLHPDLPTKEGGDVLVERVAVEGDGVGVLDHEGAGEMTPGIPKPTEARRRPWLWAIFASISWTISAMPRTEAS